MDLVSCVERINSEWRTRSDKTVKEICGGFAGEGEVNSEVK